MEFRFKYQVRPESLWLLSMHNMYKSMVGLVNIIFTVSMVLLAFRFWPELRLSLKLAVAAGILLFPLFQPLFLFLRSRKIVSRLPGDLEMIINAEGLVITSGESRSVIAYADLKSILRLRGMLVLSAKSGQTYILGKVILEDKEQSLFDFLSKNMS